jgi:hypothetical protein
MSLPCSVANILETLDITQLEIPVLNMSMDIEKCNISTHKKGRGTRVRSVFTHKA